MVVKQQNEKIIVLIVYVDDIMMTENNEDEMVNFKSKIANEFEIKNFGALKYFLGSKTRPFR